MAVEETIDTTVYTSIPARGKIWRQAKFGAAFADEILSNNLKN